MMKRIGRKSSDKLETGIVSLIESFVGKTNKRGSLDSNSRLFIALSLGQSAKGIGCSLKELTFLAGIRKGRAKSALKWFEEMGILSISSTDGAVPIASRVRIYIRSSWLRGKPHDYRASGRPVPLYKFTFVDKKLTVQTLENAMTSFTTNDFTQGLVAHLENQEETDWKRYVKFARILLSEIRRSAERVGSLYGEFLPPNLTEALKTCLVAISSAEQNCGDKKYVLDLLVRARELLVHPVDHV